MPGGGSYTASPTSRPPGWAAYQCAIAAFTTEPRARSSSPTRVRRSSTARTISCPTTMVVRDATVGPLEHRHAGGAILGHLAGRSPSSIADHVAPAPRHRMCAERARDQVHVGHAREPLSRCAEPGDGAEGHRVAKDGAPDDAVMVAG